MHHAAQVCSSRKGAGGAIFFFVILFADFVFANGVRLKIDILWVSLFCSRTHLAHGLEHALRLFRGVGDEAGEDVGDALHDGVAGGAQAGVALSQRMSKGLGGGGGHWLLEMRLGRVCGAGNASAVESGPKYLGGGGGKVPPGMDWTEEGGVPPPPSGTFRPVAVSLRGPGQSPVLPFACCVGSLRSVGRCGRCSCWCRFRVRGAQWSVCRGCAGCGGPPPPSRAPSLRPATVP